MGLFYFFVGKDRLEKPRSGVRIERYTLGERVLHWYTALLFVTMAITGLSLLLGRVLLIPIFGHWAVSGYLQTTKMLHNYCGPFLLRGNSFGNPDLGTLQYPQEGRSHLV